jgi:hypothetical protein
MPNVISLREPGRGSTCAAPTPTPAWAGCAGLCGGTGSAGFKAELETVSGALDFTFPGSVKSCLAGFATDPRSKKSPYSSRLTHTRLVCRSPALRDLARSGAGS